MLVETATAEESQARARRSAFRTIELLGELQDNSLLRKYLVPLAEEVAPSGQRPSTRDAAACKRGWLGRLRRPSQRAS